MSHRFAIGLVLLTIPVLASSPFESAGAADLGAHHAPGSPPAHQPVAPPAPLCLADLEQMALAGNPTLAQAAALTEAARSRALQAGLYPNPTLNYIGNQIGVEGTAGEAQGGYIDQWIITGGKLRLSRAKYEQEVVQGQWQMLLQQYRVLNSIRQSFYRVLIWQRLIELRSELIKVAEGAVQATEERLKAGQANPPDLLQAQIDLDRERAGLENAQAGYLAAWQQLAALVGNPCLAPTLLCGNLEEVSSSLDFDATLAHLLEASPEIQIARTEIVRDQLAVKREKVEWVPNVLLRGGTVYNFEAREQTYLVRVGVPLPIFDRNQGTIREAQADLARAQAELQRVELSLRYRLADAFARYQTALKGVQNYRDRILPRSCEAYEWYRASYNQKKAVLPQVLQARRNYLLVRIEYVQALGQLRQEDVAIRGLLLVDGLAQPTGPTPAGHRESVPKPR
jgi:cobalt-zinc-cadmium efflux system outer membrane protein